MIQDVETRWNSTYNMLERICEQQASICAALVDLKRVDLMLQDNDVKIMENLVEILKPFFSNNRNNLWRKLHYSIINQASPPSPSQHCFRCKK